MPKYEPLLTKQDFEEIDQELAKELKKLEKRSFKSLIEQIEAEYQISYAFLKPKWDEWAIRLKLYNNQKRDKEAVGDPLMFTVMNTVLASLYSDQLQAEFAPNERGDEEVADILNGLAEYDHDDMQKDILDYEWDWDTCFFGRGLVLFNEFDKKTKTPIPTVLDPMTVLRAPRAKSVNGGRDGKGRARFMGWESRETKNELKSAGSSVYFNLDSLKKGGENDVRSLIDRNHELRSEAQGMENVSKMEASMSGENYEYKLLNWFTVYKGKRVLVTLANNRKTIVRFKELPTMNIPIIDRPMYPIAHDWDGVSIPDLTEDKQRARAVVQNLGLKGIKADLHPMYVFNTNKIKNKADLNFEFNKNVPVDGDVQGAVAPIQRNSVKQEANWILEILDTAAQRANATPEIQQGMVSNEKRTATELNLATAKVDTRYSLSAKIWGWSEKRFWQRWYGIYKDHFKDDIDEKNIRINGAMGFRWRGLTRHNIVGHSDPDVTIESKILAEAKRMRQLQQFNGYVNAILQDPNANKRAALRHLGKLTGLPKDMIQVFLPLTPDELMAEEENILLDKNTLAEVRITDNHIEHMEVHNKSLDTPAKYAHIQAHKRAMVMAKERPDLLPQTNETANPAANPFDELAKNATPSAQPRAVPISNANS